MVDPDLPAGFTLDQADPPLPDGFALDSAPKLHTYAAKKRDGSLVQFQLPENAPDEVVRQHAAKAVGDDAYLRASVDRQGAPAVAPPPEDHSALDGFAGGLLKPIDTAAGWLDKIPGVHEASDYLAHATGLPTASEANAEHQAFRDNNSRAGWQGVGGAVGTIPTLALPGGALAQGAASGLLLGDRQGVGGSAIDAGIGAVTGGLGAAALKGLGAVAAPTLTKAQAVLRDAGVEFTPGQLVGGAAKHVEDALTHLPFVGDAISAARARGYQQFNRGAVNDALAHIKQAVPDRIETGHGAIAFAKQAFGRAYDNALARSELVPDHQLVSDVADVARRATDGTLNAESAAQLQKTALSVIGHRFQSGNVLDGQAVKSIVTELRVRAGQASDPAYKEALSDLGAAVRSAASRSSAPEVAGDLAAADTGYAKYAVLRRAAAAPENGVFSPAQLQTASRANDTSIGKGSSATGDAILQPYAEAGREVLPNKVGDSGTGPRVLVNSVAGSAATGGAFMSPGAAALTALGAGIGSAAYSAPAIRLLNQAFARQAGQTGQNTALLLRSLAPVAGAVAAPTAVQTAPR